MTNRNKLMNFIKRLKSGKFYLSSNSLKIWWLRPQKVNNMFLRHFFLENNAGGWQFIFYFIELNAMKRCIRVLSVKIFNFYYAHQPINKQTGGK